VTASVALYAALLGAVALGRLVELRQAAKNERALRAEGGSDVDAAGFPGMVALHVALFALPLAEVVLLDRPFDWRIAAPALALLVGATALRLAVIRALGRFWSARAVVSPATAVCASGPYRFVRHPNYVAVAAEMLALPLVHSAWISATVLSLWNGAVIARRVRAEERALFAVPGYAEAMGGKARFIPGVL
jgi:methyltransferase